MLGSRSFPDTLRTWIHARLGDEARTDVNCHLMEVYAEPLRALCRSRLRLDPESALDAVHGFFATRLDREDYLRAWQASGMQLRDWLWHGLRFHLHERRRDERRLRTMPELPDPTDDSWTELGREMDRAIGVSMVQVALRRAADRCRAEGFAEHWEVFSRRHEHGSGLAAIARDLGLPPDRVSVMLRAPTRRFREELTQVLVADGVARAEVPRAIRSLLEASE